MLEKELQLSFFRTFHKPSEATHVLTITQKVSSQFCCVLRMWWLSSWLILANCLIIFDSLHPLSARTDINLPTYLSSLLIPSATIQASLIAVYHSDVPISAPRTAANDYSPS